MFISTLLIDDPNVADEASLPTFSFLPQPSDGGRRPVSTRWNSNSTNASPRISASRSRRLSVAAHAGRQDGQGWENLEGALKYKVYVNDEHEFMLSLGVFQEFAPHRGHRLEWRGARQ